MNVSSVSARANMDGAQFSNKGRERDMFLCNMLIVCW
jgi:hypothetical protein